MMNEVHMLGRAPPQKSVPAAPSWRDRRIQKPPRSAPTPTAQRRGAAGRGPSNVVPNTMSDPVAPLSRGDTAVGSAHLPLIEKLLRSLVCDGSVTVIDSRGRGSTFGDRRSDRSVTVRLRSATLPLRIALSPSLAFGEAYMDGTLTIESGGNIRDLLALVTADMSGLEQHPLEAARTWLASHLRRFVRSNSPKRSRANVQHHYDLSTKLYDLFLDHDRQYSCAYFTSRDQSLEAAQAAKKRHIAGKLRLSPGHRVLEIGSGWGGLAIELARTYGVLVTGVTLSDEQLKYARAKAAEAGVAERVRFEISDYRSIDGRFDRIVSVGMFEHVGRRNFPAFFDAVKRNLDPSGIALLSAIGRTGPPTLPDRWINKYIFPGGYIPSLSETLAVIEPTGLWLTDMEILRLHYADTLKEWFDRFQERRSEAASLYSERFCRMWEFYLAACEMLFRNGRLMVFQLQLAREPGAAPLTRDYMTDFDRLATSVPLRSGAAATAAAGEPTPASSLLPNPRGH